MRADLDLIANFVPHGSRVLDLGCGSGALMRYLSEERGCTGTGVEIDGTLVRQAIRSGVPVLQLDVDNGLDSFADTSYDVVVLSRTIQTILRPERVLQDMARIGTTCIVSVPNFGLWRNRMRLLRGHVPMSKDLPYRWYESPNLRFTTLMDLERLFATVGLRVEERVVITERGRRLRAASPLYNLIGSMGVYLMRPEEC
ncbi:methionine biosynthesis protein MetW [Propionicicella superfundia]|uniref:methionine biosynthesis protein MetW n=1 Tax=Propionicicella superfundia TaxID=348582 RepID=UPI000410E8B9|nr:methionine biosynthesis protein MetW [Propionicicella superfundia]